MRQDNEIEENEELIPLPIWPDFYSLYLQLHLLNCHKHMIDDGFSYPQIADKVVPQ